MFYVYVLRVDVDVLGACPSADQFNCSTAGKCIDSALKCNGQCDCSSSDCSDEKDCSKSLFRCQSLLFCIR